jgi:hypothetical protein
MSTPIRTDPRARTGATDSSRARVIVIVALPHSGSHLLSQLLGAHDRCLSIGELHNYEKHTDRLRTGSDNIISGYGEDALFSGLSKLPVNDWHVEILKRAGADYPLVTTLVDNSKRVGWCASLIRNPSLDVHPVHLIRDPRALLRYWLLSYDRPKKIRRQRIRHARMRPFQAPMLLSCSPRELYVRKWLIRNEQATALLRDSGHSANVVSYHDLATRPESVLRSLMPRLGLDYQAGQLKYGEATQHGTLKRDYQEASTSSAIRLDVRWQTDLSAADIRAVTEDDRVRAYLSSLDLDLSEDGLTARVLG